MHTHDAPPYRVCQDCQMPTPPGKEGSEAPQFQAGLVWGGSHFVLIEICSPPILYLAKCQGCVGEGGGYWSHNVPALNKRSMLKDQLYMAELGRSNKTIIYFEPHFGRSIGASRKDQLKRSCYCWSILEDQKKDQLRKKGQLKRSIYCWSKLEDQKKDQLQKKNKWKDQIVYKNQFM